jgi:MFS family permease
MPTSFESAGIEANQPDVPTKPVVEIPIKAAEGSGAAVVAVMLAPFKIRNFSLLFSGQAVSSIGDALFAVALPFLVFNNGGNAQELGIVLAAYGIPRVCSILPGGWLSDKLRPRRLMLLADTVRALLVGILAALAIWGHPNLWQLCIVAFPLGAFQGLFLPASLSILPEILAVDDLQAGNALTLISTQATMLVGSAAAAVLVATLRSGPALVIDALTFVVSAVSLALMRGALTVAGQSKQQMQGKDAKTPTTVRSTEPMSLGRFLRTSRLVQVAFLVSIAANFCFGGLQEVALPTLVQGPLGAGANGYGLILAGFGAGALTGGIFASMLGRIPHKGLIGLLASVIEGTVIALIPQGGLPGAIIFMFIGGVTNSITNVLLLTVMQSSLPQHLMGRVMGLFVFAAFGSFPISVVLAGVLTNHFGPAILFPFSGLALILAISFGLTQRELREL